MKTDREVLQYVYDIMVSRHMEPSSQWYMLELRRIIGQMGKEEAGGPAVRWVDPERHQRAMRTDLDQLLKKVERIERSMPAYTPLRGMVDEIRGDMMNFADRIGSLEMNVGDHERQLGVLNRVVTAGWASAERPGEKGAGDDYLVVGDGQDKVAPV